jgi:microcystin-dependent protein
MSDYFVGEIRMTGFGWPPKEWAGCDGQIMSIAQNQALFSLIGSQFGGDGHTTFGLPDLRCRVPVHAGNGVSLAEAGGVETVTLMSTQMPAHEHTAFAAASEAEEDSPANHIPGTATIDAYASPSNMVGMGQAIGQSGGNQAHDNVQPSLAVNFCIALYGLYPPRQ